MLSIYEELVNEKIEINIDTYRNDIHKLYHNKNKDELYKEYDKIKNNKLISSIEELNLLKKDTTLEELDNTFFIQLLKIECIKELINNKIDTKEINKYKNNKFRYYPRINEYKDYDKFLKDLSKKKEFGIHFIPKVRKNSCINDLFSLAPHQLFLKNYMSPNTPYNSILIFHGVGVGKTCSGVSIAENFKNIFGKIIILAPEKIQGGWRKNIYDPNKKQNQCTYDEYIQEEDIYEKNKENIAKKKIKEHYEMFGYLSFANSVKRYLEENTKMIHKNDIISLKRKEIELIKEKYSNRVLIIDEVHKIRSEDSLIKERDTILYIEKVIKYSDNLKLILLTANPMFNQPEEIIWILNMMLLNDKRAIIKENINFDEKNNLSKESEDLIRYYSRGYISYLRGENPTTFPYRIDISQIKGEEKNILKPKRKTIFNTENTTPEMKFMELYSSKLKGTQLEKYKQEIKLVEGKEKISDVTYYGKMLQICNCIFPVNSDDINDCYGTDGLRNCFSIKNKKPVKYSFKKNIKNFLDLDELGNYACKIKTIIEKIMNSEGITFVYSNFLDGGIMPLVLALEQNGFSKYDKEEVLISKNKRKPISYDGNKLEEDGFRATYSVIAGSSLKLTNNFEKELNILNYEENKDGKLIKVVIGSTVAAEGIDFKNIRNIHLLEPWHNINKLEQVIGRGIRNCSHSMLSEDKFKNVTTFLHSCDINDNESIETYMYHSCEDKATQIGNIEKILKEVSIDKYLFRNSNIIKESDIDEISIKPSLKGNNEFVDKPFDKPYSRTCSFLESCDYIDDNFSVDEKAVNDKLENSTFKIEYSQPIINTYKKYIERFICDFMCLDYTELEKKMKDIIENFISSIFNYALDQLVSSRQNISINQTIGIISYINGYYVFQPLNIDKYSPCYYRVNSGKKDKNGYILPSKDKSNYLPEIEEYEDERMFNIILQINKRFLSRYKKLTPRLKNYDFKEEEKEKIKEFVIDRLTINERRKIMYLCFLVKTKKEETLKLIDDFIKKILQDKLKKINKDKPPDYISEKKKEIKKEIKNIKKDINNFLDILSNYSRLFIYSSKKDEYSLIPKGKVIGFFLYQYENNESGVPLIFIYREKKTELCSFYNSILENIILNSLYKCKIKEIYPNHQLNEYGTLKYTPKMKDTGKDPIYNMNLFHKRITDVRGKILYPLGGWREQTSSELFKYIQKEYNLINADGEQPIKAEDDRITLIILVELILRFKDKFISVDIHWLYIKKLKE